MAEAVSKGDPPTSPLNIAALTGNGSSADDGLKKEPEVTGSVQTGSVTSIMAGIKPDDRGHPERKRRASCDSLDVSLTDPTNDLEILAYYKRIAHNIYSTKIDAF